MPLAIFDLDNTLLGDDSDYLWGQFIIEQGLVDEESYSEGNERFYQDYVRGDLDIYAYLAFVAEPLKRYSQAQLDSLHQQFMAAKIEPVILEKGRELLAEHRRQGHQLMIITATNSTITAPIAKALGVEVLLAPELEVVDGYITGEVIGTPTFQQGKVSRLQQWLAQHGGDLGGAFFYSDSHNDLPLLKVVDNPVAVDPDDTLRAYAQANGMPIISLR